MTSIQPVDDYARPQFFLREALIGAGISKVTYQNIRRRLADSIIDGLQAAGSGTPHLFSLSQILHMRLACKSPMQIYWALKLFSPFVTAGAVWAFFSSRARSLMIVHDAACATVVPFWREDAEMRRSLGLPARPRPRHLAVVFNGQFGNVVDARRTSFMRAMTGHAKGIATYDLPVAAILKDAKA